ncbi:DUF1648 domain-containing protein [Gottfriedia luciferensis]|uniref:DUF1648 domain-containing protein n=1 Tax=Gottfriedia luciferensis TaxID=178774 RepID=UPI00115505D4|nr:DUF1648 domain-containing protein [Gottfriedia luciferensis]
MENRPILNIEETSFQKWMNYLSLVIIAISAVYIIIMYGKLPNEVPMHFNFIGNVDLWGPKWTIFIFLGIILILYTVNTFTQSVPHKFNYFVKITDENAEKQYKLAIQMMAFLKLELMILIAYLLWTIVQDALESVNHLNHYGVIALVVCLFSTLVIYGVKSRKYR